MIEELKQKYNMVEKSNEMFDDTFEITVTADYNDGDYVTEVTRVHAEKFEKIYKAILCFNEFEKNIPPQDNNWEEFTEEGNEEEIDNIYYIMPSAPENCDIHTIEEIKVLFYSKEDLKIYQVVFD